MQGHGKHEGMRSRDFGDGSDKAANRRGHHIKEGA